jgi:hypothetical protein
MAIPERSTPTYVFITLRHSVLSVTQQFSKLNWKHRHRSKRLYRRNNCFYDISESATTLKITLDVSAITSYTCEAYYHRSSYNESSRRAFQHQLCYIHDHFNRKRLRIWLVPKMKYMKITLDLTLKNCSMSPTERIINRWHKEHLLL